MALDYVILTNHRPPRELFVPSTVGQQLLSAIKHEPLSAVVQLLEKGDAVNQRGDNYWTPLTLACQLGRTEVVEYLLSLDEKFQNDTTASSTSSHHHSCDVDQSNDDVDTTSSSASSHHHSCDVNHSNDYGDTPLICAAREGHGTVVQLLLESGADTNLANQYSNLTPLLVAIDNEHVHIVTALLAYDADVQLTDNVKLTPLYTAIKVKDWEKRDSIVHQIIQAGCDVNIGSQDHAPIFLASRMGYLSVVQMLCEANCDVNISNKYRVTPIYEAAIKGHNSVVSYLLSRGCQVNTPDMYGVSPLHAAALFNNPAAVTLLLKAGASVKQRDQTGRCAVHTAMEQGFADVVRVFLRHGVDITQPPTSIKRMSSLNKIFEDGHLETVWVLISGCSKLPLNKCPAAIGVFRCNPDLLELLLLSGLSSVFAETDHRLDVGLMDRLNKHHTTPLSLQNICRIQIRSALKNKILYSSEMLPLPQKLKDFITFSHR